MYLAWGKEREEGRRSVLLQSSFYRIALPSLISSPLSLPRYCDLDARHRLCNYKGDATAYATSCLDNALAAARLVLAAGGKK